ncbi:Lecithin:cholesterol acyltransferase [Tessaracoccus bendigoensis DSM 12906]|uniref:Lecithin:cholesterol acyltransferase n=1 Tax=Tessaracoccus bendigoensis DSM 12906 TaxID=1123357 RepID=A0A1M6KYM3_9ACTN|nr:hypothetical protein [Tessaracoccus bendigoensis]SHJ64091.1 Lecithin:cholesterol acyltransferase [Tessaracoccus bendigoensis DSM 12906]
MTAPPKDLVVVLPGILGSTLHLDGRPIWEPSGGAVLNALGRLGGRGIRSLILPAGIGDNPADDGITPGQLMPDVHAIPGIWTPIKGYDDTLKRLRALGYSEPSAARPGNLLPLAYDWRLSNRYTARWMAPIIQRELARWRSQGGHYADAQVVFLCHSMGGLVARWYATHEGADHTRKIITLGTPYRGSMKAVNQLVNGAPRLLGRLGATITALARSLPAVHQLLPSYACVIAGTGEPTHLDPGKLPDVDWAMASDGLSFHAELEEAEALQDDFRNRIHPIVGTHQPTATTLQTNGTSIWIHDGYDGNNFFGDSTVPLPGATPKGVPLDSNIIRRVPDKHGNLQRNKAALDEVEGILTAQPVVIKGPKLTEPSVEVPELVHPGEGISVHVAVPPSIRVGLHTTLTPDDPTSRVRGRTQVLRLKDGEARAHFEDVVPGSYTLTVSGTSPSAAVASVTATVLVWDPDFTLDS